MFIIRLFKRHKTQTSLFSSALNEAITDTLKEMGYMFDKEKKENANGDGIQENVNFQTNKNNSETKSCSSSPIDGNYRY
jgi:hypothetical protein